MCILDFFYMKTLLQLLLAQKLISKVKVTLRSDPKRTLGEEAGTQKFKIRA